MKSANHFDESAKTWDSDPVKIARATAVAQAILGSVPISSDIHALEYGCGTGLLSFALGHHLRHITLADSSAGMLSVLDDKIRAAQATNMITTKLDLVTDHPPVDRYDLIYTLMTFHHIEDTEDMLGKLFARLSPSGYLCVADLDAEDGSFHGAEFTGHKGFDRKELGRQAARAGFRDVSFSTVFQMCKHESRGQTVFPIFLMVAAK